MARGERNWLAGGVFEGDLGLAAGFFPGAFDNGAVLEDVGLAGADVVDFFVDAVGIFGFVDDHGDDDARGELGGVTTGELGGDFADAVGATIGEMGVAAVGAVVGVGGGVVDVGWVETAIGAKGEGDLGNLWGESLDGIGGGGVDVERVGGEVVDAGFGRLIRGEASETLDV